MTTHEFKRTPRTENITELVEKMGSTQKNGLATLVGLDTFFRNDYKEANRNDSVWSKGADTIDYDVQRSSFSLRGHSNRGQLIAIPEVYQFIQDAGGTVSSFVSKFTYPAIMSDEGQDSLDSHIDNEVDILNTPTGTSRLTSSLRANYAHVSSQTLQEFTDELERDKPFWRSGFDYRLKRAEALAKAGGVELDPKTLHDAHRAHLDMHLRGLNKRVDVENKHALPWVNVHLPGAVRSAQALGEGLEFGIPYVQNALTEALAKLKVMSSFVHPLQKRGISEFERKEVGLFVSQIRLWGEVLMHSDLETYMERTSAFAEIERLYEKYSRGKSSLATDDNRLPKLN